MKKWTESLRIEEWHDCGNCIFMTHVLALYIAEAVQTLNVRSKRFCMLNEIIIEDYPYLFCISSSSGSTIQHYCF